jgi:hypothetical protein
MLLTPVMVNILLINIFFEIAFGAEIVAAFILIVCLLLLWHERARLIAVFWSDQRLETTLGSTVERIVILLVTLTLLALVVLFATHPAQ